MVAIDCLSRGPEDIRTMVDSSSLLNWCQTDWNVIAVEEKTLLMFPLQLLFWCECSLTPSFHQTEAKLLNVVISATQQSAPRRFCSCRKKEKKSGFTLNASDNLWPGSCSCCLWPLKSFQIHFLLEVTSLLGEESHYIRGEVSGRLPLV